MITIRPCKYEDFGALDMQPVDEWVRQEWDIYDQTQWVGHAFTAVNEAGKPIGISGLSVDENGVGTGWLLGSRELRSHPMFMHRTMARVIRNLRQDSRLKRLQVVVDATAPETVKWVERLGFRRDANTGHLVRYVMEAA